MNQQVAHTLHTILMIDSNEKEKESQINVSKKNLEQVKEYCCSIKISI